MEFPVRTSAAIPPMIIPAPAAAPGELDIFSRDRPDCPRGLIARQVAGPARRPEVPGESGIGKAGSM